MLDLEHVHVFVKRITEHEFPDLTLSLKYQFVHVLYQNALYASLQPTRRTSLSGRSASKDRSRTVSDCTTISAGVTEVGNASRMAVAVRAGSFTVDARGRPRLVGRGVVRDDRRLQQCQHWLVEAHVDVLPATSVAVTAWLPSMAAPSGARGYTTGPATLIMPRWKWAALGVMPEVVMR